MVPLHSGVTVKVNAPGAGVVAHVKFKLDFNALKYDKAKASLQVELVNFAESVAESTKPISFNHPVAAEYLKTPK